MQIIRVLNNMRILRSISILFFILIGYNSKAQNKLFLTKKTDPLVYKAPYSKITVKELEAYLNDRIPELSNKYHGQAQFPRSWSSGQDFPLVMSK